MTRQVVEGVEQLDQALKRKEAPEVVRPLLSTLGTQLQGVIDAVDQMEEIS